VPGTRDEDVTAHVERCCCRCSHAREPPVLVGYCLGGTMAIAAAAPHAGAGSHHRRALALSGLWRTARLRSPSCGTRHSRLRASSAWCRWKCSRPAFWQLDPARTIAKFERFAGWQSGSAAAMPFVALEDWANGGAPLTLCGAATVRRLLPAPICPAQGRWQVGGDGHPDLACSTSPSILRLHHRPHRPRGSAPRLGEATLSIGHVGMIVGGPRPRFVGAAGGLAFALPAH
jgi:polyhydroxyalkanoate synthase